MNLKSVFAVALIISSFGLTAAQGKTLRNAGEPAEFPPASYKGKQYVDSRGCSYIRAGIDGLVQWVPHVTRKRQVVCGQKPTFSAGQRAAVVAKAPPSKAVQIVPKELPVQKAAPKPAAKAAPKPKRVVQPKPVKIAPKPAPRVAAAPKIIVPKTVQRVQPRVVKPTVIKPTVRVAPAPKVVRKTAPQPVQRKVATRRSSCTNFTGISAQYAGRGNGVRCGSQTQGLAPATTARQPAAVVRKPAPQRRVVAQNVQQQPRIITRNSNGQINANGATRVVPRHVYNNQQAAKVPNKVPKGYRPAWDDDRLNTKRANMSVNGIRQSDLIWTRTVPRKLYLRSSGRVVNKLFPKLRYPYTSMADQNKAMGLTASTRNAAKPAKPQATAGGRFIQVGTYSQAGNANRAAAKLQSAGLPVRMGTLKRSGKSYRIVMAGPFAGNQLNGALSKARRAGFSDAFVR